MPWWLWPNLLSLDAPAVAVIWLWAFAREGGLEVPRSIYGCLALAVWIIYTVDRLQDARGLDPGLPASERHRFHVEHSSRLKGMVAVAGVLALALAIQGIRWEDAWILLAPVCASILYLSHLRRGSLIPKEIACGVIFSLGTIVYLASRMEPALWAQAGWFALLCSANCLCISRWEAAMDRYQDPAPVSALRHRLTRSIPVLLGLLVLGPLLTGATQPGLTGALILGALGLSALVVWEDRIAMRARRVLADVVLCSPLCTAWF